MKRIAITMGDPGGVGPEIIVKALNDSEIREYLRPIVVGDRSVFEEVIAVMNVPLKINTIPSPEGSVSSPGSMELIDIGANLNWKKRIASPEGGRMSVACIEQAASFAMDKKVDAIVTGPISKEALKMAGFVWPGHTELLASLSGTEDYAMMLVGGLLRVILVTIHTSLKDVPGMITKKTVFKTIMLAYKACSMMDMSNPRIAVAGLNPHAGEGGIFGDEEQKEIRPAVREAQQQGIPVQGPLSPDTVFHKAYCGEIDIIVCMYHDQGLIPLKMIAFDEGVNVTVGLPFIRTSPDHGTAYDIAWLGRANPSSMLEAIKLAERLNI
jgi:4-hydroxythreonine-4-phosphate dehydrogenase